MRDRTKEFQGRVDHFDDVELYSPRPLSNMSIMQRVDGRILEVRSLMDGLQSEIEVLRRKQQHILSTTMADSRDRNVLEDQINKIKRRCLELRKMVKEVDDDFAEFSKTSNSGAEVRIRKNQIDLLRRKMGDLITTFNETHEDYRSRVSVRVRRQLQAVGEDLSEQEVETMMGSHQKDQIFFREVNPLSVSGRAALEDAKQRHNEIIDLEQSIATLNDIFIDMQQLVSSQSEMVENIAQNVDNTVIQVQTGATQLKQAKDYKDSARRKKMCVAFILLLIVLILVVVAIILAVVLSNRKV